MARVQVKRKSGYKVEIIRQFPGYGPHRRWFWQVENIQRFGTSVAVLGLSSGWSKTRASARHMAQGVVKLHRKERAK